MTIPKWLPGSLCAVAALLTPAGAGAQVTVTAVGNPAYQIVDTRLFAAPQGFAPNFEPFTATAEQVFPNHFPVRVPHAGPYDTELSEGLARAGFADRTADPLFDVSEFSGPSGVFFGLMRVPGPNAPIGSSPDFASGPIVPNAAFPLVVRGDVFRNGAIFEADAFGPSATNPVPGSAGRRGDSRAGHQHACRCRLADAAGQRGGAAPGTAATVLSTNGARPDQASQTTRPGLRRPRSPLLFVWAGLLFTPLPFSTVLSC